MGHVVLKFKAVDVYSRAVGTVMESVTELDSVT